MNIFQYVQSLIARIKDRFTADTVAVVASIIKLEAKVEAAIAKDLAKLEDYAAAEARLIAARATMDANVNAAYKLLNSVAQLTK